LDEGAVLAADLAGKIKFLSSAVNVYLRIDYLLVPAAVHLDPETVMMKEGSVVTYEGQARVVEQVYAKGVHLCWWAERTTGTRLGT
jgi:hypothetical protein